MLPRGLPRTVWVLAAVSFLNDTASEMIAPLLPLFLTLTLGAGPAIVGLIEGAAEAATSVLKLAAGRLADRGVDRRKLVVGGYALANVARPLLGVAGSWAQVLTLRVADRIGKGLRSAPRDALLAASVAPQVRGRAFGVHRSADHLGAMVGPLLAAALLATGFDVREVFFAAGVLGALTIATVWLGLKSAAYETTVVVPTERAPLIWRGLDWRLRAVLVAVAVVTAATVPEALIVLWATERGVALAWIPVLWAAAHAVKALRGQTFGRIGGRPMGMNTAVANTDQWQRQFGVDVEEIDQWEIVRRADAADAGEKAKARQWLERHATVHYDGNKLTPELLERQVGSYLAMRELIDEWHLDFTGIKGQPELTQYFATMDIAEAFLNDPYDWNGPKAPHVCATEADMDGALTMQLFKQISRTPVLFADVRHYHGDRDIWDLCNSGQHATWYAARSDDPAENLARVHLYPEVFFFPAGGASVHHLAAPGEMTLGRLTRKDGNYRMQLMLGSFETYDEDTNQELMKQSTPEWPHAFARLDAPADVFLSRFGANHIHAVPGDRRAELRAVCELLDVTLDEFTRG